MSNFGPLIFIFLSFILVGGVTPFFFGIVSFLPIFIMIFVFTTIFKAGASRVRYPKSYSRVNNSQHKSDDYKTHSNRDYNRIDRKLSEYFKNNDKLPILEDIVLVPKNGIYRSVEDLYIAASDEMVLSLDEFKDEHTDIYNKIMDLLVAFSSSDKNIQKESPNKSVAPEIKISKAQSFIDQLNSLNTDINKEEVRSGLEQTTNLLKQLDAASEGENDKLSKLYEYYLPILLKILKNYKQLGKIDTNSADFKHNEEQLIKTIHLINEALKEMNKSLHEDDYMNLSADITTLQSLLKKDGLVNSNPFQKEDKDGSK